MKIALEKKLEHVSRLSKAGKVSRLLNHPLKYAFAIIFKDIIYPIFHKQKLVSCHLFTGKRMNVNLPASTDIYLTGGKTHSSEIKLARYLITNLNEGDTFWDIGAHYGYFSMLAAELVGIKGKIVSLEAAPTTFAVLQSNCKNYKYISYYHNAASDQNKEITFYELPNLYSEYNTTDVSQFENEEWFTNIKAKKVVVNAITLDHLYAEHKDVPKIIKIDVEGGELAVINGGLNLLKTSAIKPIIVMEYLEPKRNNQAHREATALLLSLGFESFIIEKDGKLKLTNDIDDHLLSNNLESDNIVFKFNTALID